jgi:hypothetical protein
MDYGTEGFCWECDYRCKECIDHEDWELGRKCITCADNRDHNPPNCGCPHGTTEID